MGYPVAYRKGSFQSPSYRPPASNAPRGPGKVVPFRPKPSGLPVGRFGGPAAAEAEVAFGRRQAARAAARAAASAVGARVAGRLLSRLIPYVGTALLAYDLWQLLRNRANLPMVDMTAFGYTLCAGSCAGPPKGLTTQAVCPPLVGCGTAQALNPGLGASARPTIYGTFKDLPVGPFQQRVDTFTRPATDPLPNGYRARWSLMRPNTPSALTTTSGFANMGAGTAGFSVASPGIGTPPVYIPPVGVPSPTPFVWAPPGMGPHPGDIPDDFPSHIPPPRWLLPALDVPTPWPQYRETGNDAPNVDPRPHTPPRVSVVGSVNPDGSTNLGKSADSPGRKPPDNPRAKERKLKAGGAVTVALARALSAYTEAGDIVDGIYDALPKALRRRLKKEGKAKNIVDRSLAIYKHADEIDFEKALINVITNEFTDRGWGQAFGNAQIGARQGGIEGIQRKVEYNAQGAFRLPN